MLRKVRLIYLLMPALLVVLATIYYFLFIYNFHQFSDYKVGLLFSTRGELANSERPIIKALRLAASEINATGGFNGRKVKLFVADTGKVKQDDKTLMKRLLVMEKVDAVFACWTSACRKEVKPLVEKHEALMFYPNQYEGVEESPNIIYLGATPNQQIVPAVKWMMDRFGKRVYLVGSDYIFPHVANEIVSKQIKSLGGKVLGESYIPLKSRQVKNVIMAIKKAQPDFIINTINGDANITFFNELFAKENLTTPTMSFSLANADIPEITPRAYPYLFASWTYFKSLKNKKNQAFLARYKARYHSVEDVNDPAVSAYAALYLLKQAVTDSPNIKPLVVRDKLLRQSVSSPAGVLYIDPYTSHTWRTVLIAKMNKQGVFIPQWRSWSPIQPVVYPRFKSKIQWEFFVYQLYLKWHKSWENHY